MDTVIFYDFHADKVVEFACYGSKEGQQVGSGWVAGACSAQVWGAWVEGLGGSMHGEVNSCS